MEKIKLKLTPAQLTAVCSTHHHLRLEAGPTRQQQANRSIISVVFKKLLKKQLDCPLKEFSIGFMYHELDVLELFLRDWAYLQPDEFTKLMIYKVADNINQKLA